MDADSKAARRLLRLTCSVQKYDWGRTGAHSLVSKLYGLNSGKRTDIDKPYAEFWMGTHESGPSFLAKKDSAGGVTGAVVNGSSANGGCGEIVSLKSWILNNPNVLGDKVLHRWGCDLPFLFKVCFLFMFLLPYFCLLLFFLMWVSAFFQKGVTFFG